jgi:L-lysine 2,3-aminomutase
LRHRRTALEELQHLLHLTTEEESGILAPNRMRLGITPCSATFISSWELLSPARQVVPTTHELERSSSDMPDPLCEDAQAPVPGLVHRYADHAQLADAGIPLGSETVLLAGINDDHAATVSADQVEGRPRLPVVEREPSGLGESR